MNLLIPHPHGYDFLRDRNMLRRMKTNHECSWVQNGGITYYRYPSGIELMIRHSMEVWVWPQLHYVVKNGSYFFHIFSYFDRIYKQNNKVCYKKILTNESKIRIYHANRKQDFMNIWLVVVKFQLNVQRLVPILVDIYYILTLLCSTREFQIFTQ